MTPLQDKECNNEGTQLLKCNYSNFWNGYSKKSRQSVSFIHPTGTLARHLFFPRQTSGANSLHLRSNFGRLHPCFPESSMARLSVCLVNLHPDNTTVPKIYHGHSSESYCFVNELKHEPEYTLQKKTKKKTGPKKKGNKPDYLRPFCFWKSVSG